MISIRSTQVDSLSLSLAVTKAVEKLLYQVCAWLAVDINACGSNNRTPLHHAAIKGHASTCSTLASANADINACATDNRTPLHHAARKGHVSTCSTLASANADINARDNNNQTPLDVACNDLTRIVLIVLGAKAGSSITHHRSSNETTQQQPVVSSCSTTSGEPLIVQVYASYASMRRNN